LGSTVVWYAYRRAADKGLYLQRAVAGVPGPETLIAQPVDKIDMIVDPDNTKAWIYFTTDGALRCIEVTDKTEMPTVQVFQRGQGWYERVEGGFSGIGADDFTGFTDLQTAAVRRDDGPIEVYPPLLAIADAPTSGFQVLLITPSQINRGAIAKFRVYRNASIAGAGWQFWSDVPYSALSTLTVAKPVSPAVYQWVATAIRYQPYKESVWSNIVSSDDQGDVALGAFSGIGAEPTMTFVDKTPIKFAVPEDSYANTALSGIGADFRFSLNGFDPLAP
jgi:hypothetical protein